MFKPLFICIKSFVLQHDDILSCTIIRNNQGSIFPSLCSCLIDGKANCRSNQLCIIFDRQSIYLKLCFQVISEFSRVHMPSVGSRCFTKKLVNTFLGCFAMQTQGASGYKPVGETLFLFIILFFAVLQHNFTK